MSSSSLAAVEIPMRVLQSIGKEKSSQWALSLSLSLVKVLHKMLRRGRTTTQKTNCHRVWIAFRLLFHCGRFTDICCGCLQCDDLLAHDTRTDRHDVIVWSLLVLLFYTFNTVNRQIEDIIRYIKVYPTHLHNDLEEPTRFHPQSSDLKSFIIKYISDSMVVSLPLTLVEIKYVAMMDLLVPHPPSKTSGQ